MIIFDEISLRITGSDKRENGNIISDFIIAKVKASKKYKITWSKREIIGASNDKNYRDLMMETHISNVAFTDDLMKLLEKHFELYMKSYESIITGG